MNDNMKIWDQLQHTDPNATKTAPSKWGKKITTIDPMSQIQSMTSMFGPVGKGWKYEVEYKYIDGLVFAEVKIKWFDKQWNEYGPVCSVQNLTNTRGGLDDEAPKKAMTDAMTKAFSHLGMSADVFLGKFDDSKYVEQMKQEFSQPQPQEIPKTNGKRNIKLDMQFNMDQIKKDIKAIDDIYLLRSWKKDNPNLFDSNQMSVREYRQITDLYGTRLTQLNQQGVV